MRYSTKARLKIKKFWSQGSAHQLPVLATVGAMSVLAYFLFAIMPFFIPGTDDTHFPPYLALPQGGFDLSRYYLLYIFICLNALMLFGLYLLALKAVGAHVREEDEHLSRPGAKKDLVAYCIFGFAVAFHIIMFFTPFLLSTDLFDYIRHGRILTVYGENPLVIPATYFPDDPFFGLGGWVGTGSVYGPIHVYLTAALARLAGNGIIANFLLFKGFFISINLVNLVLIWKIAARLKPGLEKKALLFYGWNPFVLTFVVANAHNDILMLSLVLAGILCYLDRRYLIGVLCLTLATLVKFITLPILLVYVALLIRKQPGLWKKLGIGASSFAIAGVVTVVSYLPLWAGKDTFNYLTTVGQKTNFTLASIIRDMAADHLQLSLSNTVVQLSLGAILAAYLLWQIIGIKDTAGLLSASAGLAFLTPLALFWFQPWYLTLALGLVALRPWRLMYIACLAFSFSVMFFDSFWWHAPVDMSIQKPLRVLVVFGPPMLLLLVLKARETVPGVWKKTVAWSLEGAGDPDRSQAAKEVKDPSFLRLAVEVAVLFVAALVPMAVVISSSPQLRSIANLVALKFKLITNL
ncbi:MAG: hypothetical protein WC828_00645 [Thermoleophilia bacterium]|jgi:hypothetical protein